MNKIITYIINLFKVFYPQAIWIGKKIGFAMDKVLHFEGGFLFNTIVFLFMFFKLNSHSTFAAIFVSTIVATIATGFLGLSKEIRDEEQVGNKFDPMDIKATILGGLCSSVIIIIVVVFTLIF